MEKIKELFTKHKSFFWICFFCFFLFSVYFYMAKKIEYKDRENIILKKELISRDTLLKISEGKYRKMVNYYSTKKELDKQVKDNSPEIYNHIKDNKERILSNTNIDFTFKPKQETNIISKKDSIYKFSSFYPARENSFVQYDGELNTNNNKLSEKWSFSNIKLNVVLTQKEDGLWNTYLDAPEFIKVSSLTVNSLPPKEYITKEDKVKAFNFYGGLGVRSDLAKLTSVNKNLTLNGAITFKNKIMLQADFGTDKKVSTGILIKF